jgi:hypothetical protein
MKVFVLHANSSDDYLRVVGLFHKKDDARAIIGLAKAESKFILQRFHSVFDGVEHGNERVKKINNWEKRNKNKFDPDSCYWDTTGYTIKEMEVK